jgi:hypothetical protein
VIREGRLPEWMGCRYLQINDSHYSESNQMPGGSVIAWLCIFSKSIGDTNTCWSGRNGQTQCQENENIVNPPIQL